MQIRYVLAAGIALVYASPAFAGSFSSFEDRAIIVVGGRGAEVSLNPLPLPPKETLILKRRQFGEEVSLNPQPLPPKEGYLPEFLRER